MKKRATLICLLTVCLRLFIALPPAKAASLNPVSDWGASGVPTNLSMYIYVPDKLAANPPVLVLLHYWGGGAAGVFAEAQNGGIVAAADQYGFIMVVPQNPDCWDAGSPQTLTHDGGGQTQGIVQMVNYAIRTYHANPDRVYVTGTSCGGVMTEALLGVYPDIFKAGVAFSGNPVGGAWTPITHTAREWGNIARAAYPGYSGPRPRLQLWHGTADDIINFSNQGEAIMQWTDVLGLNINPTVSNSVTIAGITNQWTHQLWQDASGNTNLEAWSEIGGGHGTDANLNAKYVIPFLGLDKTGASDPVPPSPPAVSDEFTTSTLNAHWQWNAQDNTRWSLTARAGYLRLMPSAGTNFLVAGNILTQRGEAPRSRADVKLDVSKLQPGDVCGFGTLGKTNGQIAVNCDSSGNKYLTLNVLVSTNGTGANVSQTSYGHIAVAGTTVYLRVDMDFWASLGACSYSFDGTNWTALGGQFGLGRDASVPAYDGEKYALFCYNANPGTGYVDVDWFHFNDKIQRGRPHLNAARTTFVADNGQPLRGPYTSSEWGAPAPSDQIAKIKNLGFNAVHIYGECFDINYPAAGSTAPGYSASRIDSVVQATRDLGLYLVITIGNGANNGNNNAQYAADFWKFYSQRYANETHVVFEIQNEPVAWGPPYSASNATPPGALNMEITCFNIIRQYAPNTPVLLFSYSVLGGTGGANSALQDIHAFNTTVFGNANAVWTNAAVGFHGYAGAGDTAIAVSNIVKAGYPCVMTEFGSGAWGGGPGGLDVEGVGNLERLGISWLTFQYIPPSGVSDDITKPECYRDRVDSSGLSWTPDYGYWPATRSVYGNNRFPWTTPSYINNVLNGTLRIEAENFDNGGKGVAYYNGNGSNPGGQYRMNETVGIETTSDTGGGYDVGWIAAGDWLEYTIKVSAAGTYNLRLRVAGTSAGSVRLFAAGDDITGQWALPNTGGFQAWRTAATNVFLTPGQQRLRVHVLTGGFNLNWIELSPASTGPIPDGSYKILNAATAQALDIGTNNNIVTAAYTGSNNQKWNIQHIGGGEYKVTSASNGNAWNNWMGTLHLTGWWGAGGDQCFIFIPTGGGYYRMFSAGGGSSYQPAANTPPTLDQKAWTGTPNQQWALLSPSTPVFPSGLTAVAVSSTQVTLTWNAVAAVSSYNVKRSTNSGGPYTTVATKVTATNYTDTVIAGVKCYYVVSAVANGIESLNSVEATPRFPALAGSVIGTAGSWNNSGNTIAKVFDNDLTTFFDAPTGNGCWVGLDFGAGVSNAISQINYCPRSGFESRMVGGIFQGANRADFSGAVTLYTVTAQPTAGVFTSVVISNATAFRYVRFLSPNNGFCNVAELKFYGYTPSAPVPTPTGLSALAVSTSQIKLNWSALANASYKVKRSTTNGGPYTIIANSVATTNYLDNGLAGGTIYYYVVSAVVAGNESQNSTPASAAMISPVYGSLVHRYNFTETSGVTVADSVGGPVWAGTLPNGGALSGSGLTLSAASQQYVSLPSGVISSLSNITIMAWVNLASSSTWSRIFDFGSDGNTNMFLTPQCDSGALRFAITTGGAGAEQQINCSNSLTIGQWHQVAVALAPGKGVLYLDGAAVGTNSAMTLTPVDLGVTVNNYIGKSQYPDPCLDGSINQFRIYNTNLSPAEIAATAALGPDQLLSTNSPAISWSITGSDLLLSWPLECAGYTLQSRTDVLAGGWEDLTSSAPQIIDDQWQVSLPLTNGGPVFYRLVKKDGE